ncbi:MAG: hypothetical protein ACRERU_11000 [Methylococcales bacterium]
MPIFTLTYDFLVWLLQVRDSLSKADEALARVHLYIRLAAKARGWIPKSGKR